MEKNRGIIRELLKFEFVTKLIDQPNTTNPKDIISQWEKTGWFSDLWANVDSLLERGHTEDKRYIHFSSIYQ